MKEEGGRPELFLLQNLTSLRPPTAQPIFVGENVTAAASDINKRIHQFWPALQVGDSFSVILTLIAYTAKELSNQQRKLRTHIVLLKLTNTHVNLLKIKQD